MKKILPVAIALAITACASPPKPEVPSPYGRTPVNSEAAIQEYQQQSSSEAALRRERNDLKRQLNALQHQLEELRAYFIMQAADQAGSPPAPAPAPAPAPTKHAPERIGGDSANAPPKQTSFREEALAPEKGQMTIGTDSIQFRVFQQYAATEFEPDPEMAQAIVRAARSSDSVVIRGRTDSNYANDANQRIAMARGLSARRYLIENGVNPAKIRVYYLSTGDFIADNGTAEGRSRNRRVELEARGIDVSGFKVSSTI